MKNDVDEKLMGVCMNLARALRYCYACIISNACHIPLQRFKIISLFASSFSKASMPADSLLVFQNLKLDNHLQFMYRADAEYSNGDLEKALASRLLPFFYLPKSTYTL